MRPASRSAASRTNDAADHVSGDAEPAGWPLAKPIEAIVGSVPYGDGAQVGGLPVLLGDQPDAGGERAHAVEQRGRAGARRRSASGCSPRSAESTGQRCPVPWPDGAQGRPSLARSP